MSLQAAGALQEAQVPGSLGRGVCPAGQQPPGEPAGLQDHHARREQGEPHELHCQRAGRALGHLPCPWDTSPGLFYTPLELFSVWGRDFNEFLLPFLVNDVPKSGSGAVNTERWTVQNQVIG